MATALNTDIDNVDHYQYGRTKPVYTDGTNYYFATAKGEKPPADWDNWKLLSNEEWLRGYSVYEATAAQWDQTQQENRHETSQICTR